ncbi:MAG: hypothetical protein Q4C72_10605, partial [Eubacteriales bacterium]|nr:hypothetical protein [Eubacteriales bacterium]
GGGSGGGWGGGFGGGFGGIRTGPIFVNNSRRYSGGGGGGNNNGGDGNGGNSGCGTLFIVFAVVVVLVAAVSLLMGGGGGGIAKSTVAREKLPASAVSETAYYTDEDGDWIRHQSRLENGLKRFYKQTGVQPYVYILPNGETTSVSELTERAETLYPQLFKDEGHFLLVFCDDNRGSYNCGYTVGSQAKTIMDNEAVGILADYLDRYYDSADTEEEVFSLAFEKTGERIMTVTKSPVVPVAVCIAVVIVAILIFVAVKKHREQREREQKRAEEILKTPLEKFGDQDVEDLAKKYQDKDE